MAKSRAKRVALDIGTSSIKVCQLDQTKEGFVLSKFGYFNLNIDPAMPPENKKKIKIEAIREALAALKIKHKKTIFAVPGQSVFIRNRTLPPVPESKVTQIVQYEIQQQIPFPPDQIALDYQILKRTEAREYEVLMVAIKVDTVDSFAEVITDSKLRIDTVDVGPLAAYNWFRYSGELPPDGGIVACLDFGASTTDIFIESGGELRMTRSLTISGNQVTEAIRDALGLTFVEAEQIKKSSGYIAIDGQGPPPDVQPHPETAKIAEAIAGVLERLVGEIARSFGYFRSQPSGGPVAQILLCGCAAALRNLGPFLQARLGVPVRFTDAANRIPIGEGGTDAQSVPLALPTSLGLALRNHASCPIEVNLIPPRIIEAEKRKEKVVYWTLSFLAVILILLSIIPLKAAEYEQMLTFQKQLDKNIQLYTNLDVEFGEVTLDIENLEAKLERIQKLRKRRASGLSIVRDIASALPSDVWLTSITCLSGYAKPGEGGTGGLGAGGRGAFGGLGGLGRGGLSGASGGFAGLGAGGMSMGRRGDREGTGGMMGGGMGQRAQGTEPQPVNAISVAGHVPKGTQESRGTERIETLVKNLKNLKRPNGKPLFSEVVFFPEEVQEVDRASLQTVGGSRATPGLGMSRGSGGFGGPDDDRDRGRGMMSGLGGFGGMGALGGGAFGRGAQPGGYYGPAGQAKRDTVFSFSVVLVF
jgi:type IV pilus assembly protein PilM